MRRGIEVCKEAQIMQQQKQKETNKQKKSKKDRGKKVRNGDERSTKAEFSPIQQRNRKRESQQKNARTRKDGKRGRKAEREQWLRCHVRNGTALRLRSIAVDGQYVKKNAEKLTNNEECCREKPAGEKRTHSGTKSQHVQGWLKMEIGTERKGQKFDAMN